MNIMDLREFLSKNLRYPDVVNINNEHQYLADTFNIDQRGSTWKVFHFEKGEYFLEREFEYESEAIEYLIFLLEKYGQLKT